MDFTNVPHEFWDVASSILSSAIIGGFGLFIRAVRNNHKRLDDAEKDILEIRTHIRFPRKWRAQEGGD